MRYGANKVSKDRANFLSYVFILAAVAVAAYLYPDLPDPMPVHWDSQGGADGYMAKPWGVVVLPLIAVALFVIMRLIPVVSPKGFHTGGFSDVLHILQVALVAFGSVVAILALLQAYGMDVRFNQLIPAAIGILFVILGNYFGKLRKNFFLGIRTPWTLASDEVWNRTHRLGGWLFTLAGIIVLGGALFRVAPAWLMLLAAAAAFVPVIYSYFIYRRIEGFGEDDEGVR